MYQFRHLDTYYDVDISLEYPDYRHTFYHCREHLVARYDRDKDLYNFLILERDNILLNKKKATEVMDLLMIELGNLLYPIEFSVSPEGELLRINNFNEVKNRWNSGARKLLDRNVTHHFRRYLQIASRNMKTEEKLREAMMRNSFIKLIVRPLKVDSFVVSFSNFPSKGTVTMYNCRKSKRFKKSGIITEYKASLLFPIQAEGDGYIKYNFTELNDIADVEARFDLQDENGQKWVKRISIKTNQEERSASHKQSVWKRMLE